MNFSFKILNSGEIVWTSPDVLDWYRVPTGRACVDRESAEDNGKGNTVMIGCLEDFIPTITEVPYKYFFKFNMSVLQT